MPTAKEIMTPDVITIQPSDTVYDAIQRMKQHGIHALIVERADDNDAYGIVTDADIAYKVVAYEKNPREIYVHEIMTKPCIVVNPDLDVEYVARLFANLHIHRAPVIKDRLLGIVSLTDILHKAL